MINKDLQLKTIAVCSDLQLEAIYSHEVVRNNESYQETKNRVLFNINAHFKL